jgi:ABC-type uncharacterized transport system ATPase subunit
MDSSIPSVKCIDLGKDFGSFTSLRNVSLSVEAGTTCTIIGPNGAGNIFCLAAWAAATLPLGCAFFVYALNRARAKGSIDHY